MRGRPTPKQDGKTTQKEVKRLRKASNPKTMLSTAKNLGNAYLRIKESVQPLGVQEAFGTHKPLNSPELLAFFFPLIMLSSKGSADGKLMSTGVGAADSVSSLDRTVRWVSALSERDRRGPCRDRGQS